MLQVARYVLPMVLAASPALAQDVASGPLAEVPESVYGEPRLQTPGSGFNEGAASIGVAARYATDYMFRGIEPVEPDAPEDATNLGIEARLSFDLGRLPNPFVQIITNTAEGDDISNFQVIRPAVGLMWSPEAFDLTIAHQSFTYPDREGLDTSEVFADIHFNDAVLSGDVGRVIGPYAFVAYDYDAFEGTYAELGIRRAARAGDSSLTLGYNAHVAYVDDLPNLFGGDGTGFQHYQLGVTARYDLNTVLNISRRYGQWAAEGQLNYTSGIDDDLLAEDQIWGGAGIVFRY